MGEHTPQLQPLLRELRNRAAHGHGQLDSDYVASRLQNAGIAIRANDAQWFLTGLLASASYYVPPVLLHVFQRLLEGRAATTVLDPWAGVGVLAKAVYEVLRPQQLIAATRDQDGAALGRVLAPELDWRDADPLLAVGELTGPLDIIVSILPWGLRGSQVELPDTSGKTVQLGNDLGQAILAASSVRLSADGLGLFVVSRGFFAGKRSVLPLLPRLGLGVEAALEVPAGTFAPFTSVTSYLVIVRKRPTAEMLAAELSQDSRTNDELVAAVRRRLDRTSQSWHQDAREPVAAYGPQTDRTLRWVVAPEGFRGLAPLHLAKRLKEAGRRLQRPLKSLGELATSVQRGGSREGFEFTPAENAIYVPLTGVGDVVSSLGELGTKHQSHIQVVIDPAQADARLVAHFLNSELGRAVREAGTTGGAIPKLSSESLKQLDVILPPLETQREVLALTAELAAVGNSLLGLRNEVTLLQNELWDGSGSCLDRTKSKIEALAARLAEGTKQHVALSTEEWSETLPFPLASILRAWRATPARDEKVRLDFLLDFFEAAAEFFGIIYLSAFSSQESFFADHREALAKAWREQNLSLERATFGTWKVAVEYFSKQTRILLTSGADKRAHCAELYSDPSLLLPETLAQKTVSAVLSAANAVRNDLAHGGVAGRTKVHLWHEQMEGELLKLRGAMAETWGGIQLIRCHACHHSQGAWKNDVELMVGSNSRFLMATWQMASHLDEDRLYLAFPDTGRSLALLPLMRLGPSPESEINACYFFNRVEGSGVRFVSYHYAGQPDITEPSADTMAAIDLVTGESPASRE